MFTAEEEYLLKKALDGDPGNGTFREYNLLRLNSIGLIKLTGKQTYSSCDFTYYKLTPAGHIVASSI